MKVQGQRSKVKVTESKFKVTAYRNVAAVNKTATDRLSDFKFATGNVLKGIGPARHRAASSCNALPRFLVDNFVILSHLCSLAAL